MVTETKHTSYLSRIGNAFKGLFLGILFVVGSVFFLFSNEGSVDLSELAINAAEVFGIEDLENLDGEFVTVTGEVNTDEVLEDEYVRYNNALKLSRNVETYAWVEDKDSKTSTNAGGSSTTKTTYTYNKEWVVKVPDSSKFNKVEGHENAYNDYDNRSYTVDTINVAGLDVDTFGLRFPATDVNVTNEVELLSDEFETNGTFLFNGEGSLDDPELGDARISYFVLPELQTGSVFGVWNSDRQILDPYFEGESKIHGLYKGNKGTALETMHKDYVTKLWLVRGMSLIFMFAGFNMLFAPFHTVLDVIPTVGKMGKGATTFVSFLLTLVLGGIVIILGKVWYSWVLFLLIVLIAVGVGYKYYKKSKA